MENGLNRVNQHGEAKFKVPEPVQGGPSHPLWLPKKVEIRFQAEESVFNAIEAMGRC